MAPDDETGSGPGAGAEPTLPPGVEQFQQAALDAVRAARAMLDAAEHAIRDPAALETLIRSAAGVARTATETVAGFAAGAMRDPASERGRPAAGDPDDPDDPDDTGYHDISVG